MFADDFTFKFGDTVKRLSELSDEELLQVKNFNEKYSVQGSPSYGRLMRAIHKEREKRCMDEVNKCETDA